MRNTFKISEDKEGNAYLWFSSHGRLKRVATYTPDMRGACTPADLHGLMLRDAKIFLKGLRKGLE